jgi:tetratricopeptide (TPR) repeat protein
VHDPHSAALLEELGFAEAMRYRWAAAAAAFESSAKLVPARVDAVVRHSEALCELGQLRAAEELVAGALGVESEETALHVQAGEIAMRAHRYLEACDCFDRALALDASSSDASRGRRKARWRIGIVSVLRPSRGED